MSLDGRWCRWLALEIGEWKQLSYRMRESDSLEPMDVKCALASLFNIAMPLWECGPRHSLGEKILPFSAYLFTSDEWLHWPSVWQRKRDCFRNSIMINSWSYWNKKKKNILSSFPHGFPILLRVGLSGLRSSAHPRAPSIPVLRLLGKFLPVNIPMILLSSLFCFTNYSLQ